MKKQFLSIILILVFVNSYSQYWHSQYSGCEESLSSIYFIDSNIGFTCGANGTILKTVNGGEDWTAQNSGTTLPLGYVQFANADTGFVVGGIWDGDGIVLRTIDGGDTWTTSGTCNNMITSIAILNSTKAIYTGGYGCGTGVGMTTDAGENWTSVDNPSSHIWNREVFFVNDTTGYIVGSYEKFIKTTDGGLTWSGTIDMTKGMYRGVYFTSIDTGFVIGAAGVNKTVDGGETWNVVLPGINGSHVKFASSKVGYAIDGLDLYKTVDSGVTWNKDETDNDTILSVHFINENFGYACGKNGAILKWSSDCPEPYIDTVFVTYYDTVHCQDYNIALEQKYTASIMDSIAYPGHNPRLAFDGDTLTAWHPQSYPPAWIAVHFEKKMDIDSISFWYGQDPGGSTVQEIYSTEDSINWNLVETINPYHEYGGGQHSHLFSNTIENSKGLKITTTQNPSWVQWKEIMVWGNDPETCRFNVFDTTMVTVNDTIVVMDTTFVTVVDSISVTDTLIIDAVLTGISTPDNLNTLKIYPNPAKEYIIINTGNYDLMDNYQIKIIDQLGSVVFETRIEEPIYEINLSEWSGTGIYFFQIIDSGGMILDIRKIILQ